MLAGLVKETQELSDYVKPRSTVHAEMKTLVCMILSNYSLAMNKMFHNVLIIRKTPEL